MAGGRKRHCFYHSRSKSAPVISQTVWKEQKKHNHICNTEDNDIVMEKGKELQRKKMNEV